MHRNDDDSGQYTKYAVVLFHALFKLDVLIPEWVGEEVQTDACGAALEEPSSLALANVQSRSGMGVYWEGVQTCVLFLAQTRYAILVVRVSYVDQITVRFCIPQYSK